MKVETKPIETKPEVVITLSWEEARILRAVVGSICGMSRGRDVTSALYEGLGKEGISLAPSVHFSGRFE